MKDKHGRLDCVVCNFERDSPTPCTGYTYKGMFIHGSDSPLVNSNFGVDAKDFFEQRCPTCLNYSCNCSARARGEFDDLSYQVERATEERRDERRKK